MSQEKREIKVSEILEMLNQGKDRKAIREELGVTHADMAAIFQHPKLKNKKPRSFSSLVVVDDVEDAGENTGTVSEISGEETVGESTEELQEESVKEEGTLPFPGEKPEWK